MVGFLPGFCFFLDFFFSLNESGLIKIMIFLKKSKKSDFFDLNRIFLISIRFFLFL